MSDMQQNWETLSLTQLSCSTSCVAKLLDYVTCFNWAQCHQHLTLHVTGADLFLGQASIQPELSKEQTTTTNIALLSTIIASFLSHHVLNIFQIS